MELEKEINGKCRSFKKIVILTEFTWIINRSKKEKV